MGKVWVTSGNVFYFEELVAKYPIVVTWWAFMLVPGNPEADERIRRALEAVLATPLFQRAEKQSAFLRYVIEKHLAGESASIKEYEIGTKVYHRSDSYDPREDPIVRVEASRLRARLREYYDTTGKNDPVRIELPKGTYIPTFDGVLASKTTQNDAILPPFAPVLAQPDRRVWYLLAGVVVVAGIGYWQFTDRAQRAAEVRKASRRTFQKASDLHAQMTPAAIKEARLLHEAILRSDPDWATAHSGLSHTYISLISVGGARRDDLGKTALAEARRSLELDPHLADGFAALVRYYRDIEMDFGSVESVCRTALEKAPDPFQILANCAPVQSIRGNHEIAELWARDAVRIRPRWSETWSVQAFVLWRAGRGAEAVAPARKAIEVDPKCIGARAILAMIAVDKDELEEAMRVMEEGLPSSGIDREEWYAYRGYVAALSGMKSEAARMYEALEQRSQTHIVSPISFARIRMGERNTEAALTLIEEAVRRRDVEAAMFITSPEALPIRNNPRYRAAARALGVRTF
ncbi:MAG: hypothetical protein HYX27_04165 [Acidobacteria bacterium]|nr:hypothetical protein [Acidobacteriota bacterium]